MAIDAIESCWVLAVRLLPSSWLTAPSYFAEAIASIRVCPIDSGINIANCLTV